MELKLAPVLRGNAPEADGGDGTLGGRGSVQAPGCGDGWYDVPLLGGMCLCAIPTAQMWFGGSQAVLHQDPGGVSGLVKCSHSAPWGYWHMPQYRPFLTGTGTFQEQGWSPAEQRSAWPLHQSPAGPWPMVAAGSSSSIPAWHRRWRRG